MTDTRVLSAAHLEAGARSPQWELHGLTRTHFVRYAGASGDFNPMHHDDEAARAAGFRGVFAPGMFVAGVLARYLHEWLGAGSLRRLRVRFLGQVWPGDSLSFSASVRGRHSRDGEDVLALELVVSNGAGEQVLSGAALAAVH
jgi:acyl dehydratase